jgi:hypothetical protein
MEGLETLQCALLALASAGIRARLFSRAAKEKRENWPLGPAGAVAEAAAFLAFFRHE